MYGIIVDKTFMPKKQAVVSKQVAGYILEEECYNTVFYDKRGQRTEDEIDCRGGWLLPTYMHISVGGLTFTSDVLGFGPIFDVILYGKTVTPVFQYAIHNFRRSLGLVSRPSVEVQVEIFSGQGFSAPTINNEKP